MGVDPSPDDYREDSDCGRAGRYIVSAGGSGAANGNTELLDLETLEW